MNLAALKTELASDPVGIGYAASIADHQALAKLMNKAGRSMDRESLSSGDLVSCLDKTEFTALPAPDKAWLNLFITAGNVPMTNEVRQALTTLFPAGSKTKQNINRMTKRDGSRAEELGFGRVTESDIADALLRT